MSAGYSKEKLSAILISHIHATHSRPAGETPYISLASQLPQLAETSRPRFPGMFQQSTTSGFRDNFGVNNLLAQVRPYMLTHGSSCSAYEKCGFKRICWKRTRSEEEILRHILEVSCPVNTIKNLVDDRGTNVPLTPNPISPVLEVRYATGTSAGTPSDSLTAVPYVTSGTTVTNSGARGSDAGNFNKMALTQYKKRSLLLYQSVNREISLAVAV